MEYKLRLDEIVGGGQTIGTLDDGRKAFVWGGLPGEEVTIRATKKKSKLIEGVVEEVLNPSLDRIAPKDPNSYLSTSPWQIMSLESEQKYKHQLIVESFKLHHVDIDENFEVFSDHVEFNYRNKVEFSWYGGEDQETGEETLDLAFFRRASRGKVIVEGTSLARPEINSLALAIRDLLRTKKISAKQLKTLLIRCSQDGKCVWQLYTKDKIDNLLSANEAGNLPAAGGEVIFSNPKSPASVITERVNSFGDITLVDNILGTPFRYACEGFFQVNIPVYEEVLNDMKRFVDPNRPTVDMYSGVGTIGLTIGGENVTLVEMNEHAVREMRRNIDELKIKAEAVLAPSEKSLEYIVNNKTIIVDPPRAGLHADVAERILSELPERIIYLSCNPTTQARDYAILQDKYSITFMRGYDFFPRTPHIENLIVLDRT